MLLRGGFGEAAQPRSSVIARLPELEFLISIEANLSLLALDTEARDILYAFADGFGLVQAIDVAVVVPVVDCGIAKDLCASFVLEVILDEVVDHLEFLGGAPVQHGRSGET